jgi:hypothetical protein
MQFSRLTTPNTGSSGSSAKQNLTATAPPAVTDDVNAGYSVGSVWIDTSADERWVCLDDTAGSAIWDKSTVGTASEVVNTPAGNITSTNVQSALNELDTLKGSQAQQTTNTSNIASNTSALASKIASMVEDASPQLGGTLDANSKAINEAQGTNIASATTTDLGAMAGNYALVTGTTTITGLGTVSAGTRRKVTFTGILTLTHNATSLILPTEANITTAVNDTAEFISLGSGNWICTNYQRADGSSLAGGGGGASVIHTFNSGYVSGVETRYTAFTKESGVESSDQFGIPLPAGTVKNMRIYLATGAGGTGIDFIVRKNGSDTALSQRVNSSTVVTDTSEVAFADGDRISLKIVPLNYNKTWYVGISVEFVPN